MGILTKHNNELRELGSGWLSLSLVSLPVIGKGGWEACEQRQREKSEEIAFPCFVFRGIAIDWRSRRNGIAFDDTFVCCLGASFLPSFPFLCTPTLSFGGARPKSTKTIFF